MSNPPAWFREALGELSPDALAAFVADVWQARGLTVRRDGRTVYVTGRSEGERRLYVAAGEETIPDEIDAVVSRDPSTVEGSFEVIGPESLFERVRYALPSAESDRLIREHLGLEPDAAGPTPSSETETSEHSDDGASAEPTEPTSAAASNAEETPADPDAGPPADELPDRDDRSRRSLLVGAGGFLAGVGVAAAGWLGPFGPAEGSVENQTAPETPTPDPVVAVPGLSNEGVEDSSVLASAHLSRLDAASYAISAVKSVHASDGRFLGSTGITTQVTDDRRMLVRLGTAGRASTAVFGDPPVQATLYSDGEEQFRRFVQDGETAYDVVALGAEVNSWFYWANIFPFGSLFISVTEYFQRLFDAVPVAATSQEGDGSPPFNLHATGVRVDPLPEVFDNLSEDSPARNLDLLATVSGAGLVRSLGLNFGGRLQEDRVTVSVAYDYHAIGETTVEEPSWIDAARATSGSGGR
ncbi:MAG: hypothetical protein ABEH64_10325 [Salinirussus sp.]